MTFEEYARIVPVKGSGYVDTPEKYEYQYTIIKKYLVNKLNNWNLWDFFDSNDRVVVYACTDMAELALIDYRNYKGKANCIAVCDSSDAKWGDEFVGKNIISPSALLDAYSKNEVNRVLVCSIFHSVGIVGKLVESGIEEKDIVTVPSVIFSTDYVTELK